MFVSSDNFFLWGFLNLLLSVRRALTLHHLSQITIMTPLLGHYGSVLDTPVNAANSLGLAALRKRWSSLQVMRVCVRATVCVCLSAYRLKYLDMSKICLSRSKGQTNNYRMRRNFLWAAAASVSAAAAAAVAAFQNDAIKLMIARPRKR